MFRFAFEPTDPQCTKIYHIPEWDFDTRCSRCQFPAGRNEPIWVVWADEGYDWLCNAHTRSKSSGVSRIYIPSFGPSILVRGRQWEDRRDAWCEEYLELKVKFLESRSVTSSLLSECLNSRERLYFAGCLPSVQASIHVPLHITRRHRRQQGYMRHLPRLNGPWIRRRKLRWRRS